MLILQSEGTPADEATKDDWLAAIDRLRGARDSGQIRRFTGNEYTEDLTAGNIVAAIGWSGDTSLIGGEESVAPADRRLRPLLRQAVIPVGAPNTPAALAFLNFAYTPKNAANITEYVQYVTPVAEVQEILAPRARSSRTTRRSSRPRRRSRIALRTRIRRERRRRRRGRGGFREVVAG